MKLLLLYLAIGLVITVIFMAREVDDGDCTDRSSRILLGTITFLIITIWPIFFSIYLLSYAIFFIKTFSKKGR